MSMGFPTTGTSVAGAEAAHNINRTEHMSTPNRTANQPHLSDMPQRYEQNDRQRNIPVQNASSRPGFTFHSQESATSMASLLSASSTVRPTDEQQEVSWGVEADLPEEYANVGYEAESHKKWREEVTAAMRTVSEQESGPKNGTTYQEGTDYVFKTSVTDFRKSQGIAMTSAPAGEKTTRQARTIAWIRRFTISTRLVDHQIEFDGHTWFLPVMLAVELHDWNWLSELCACGVMFPSTGWPMLREVRVATILELAADASLAHLKQLTDQFDEVNPVKASQCRGTTIAKLVYSYNRRPEQLTNHAIQILLDTGDPISDLGHALFRAVDTDNEQMVRLLLAYRADPNYSHRGEGATLHLVVRKQLWGFTSILVAAGADPSRAAGLYTSEVGSSTIAISPIELAARLGRLEILNEELGTDYQDRRSSITQLLSRKRRQYGHWKSIGNILAPSAYS